MARTTVEDCLRHCPNHFQLAMLATTRARELMTGGDHRRVVDPGDDKPIVIALREIAATPPEELDAAPAETESPDSGSPTETEEGQTPEAGGD